MTRQEFNSRFAASQDTTEGYTDAQLAQINDAVFAEMAEISIDDEDIAHSHAVNMFAREMNKID